MFVQHFLALSRSKYAAKKNIINTAAKLKKMILLLFFLFEVVTAQNFCLDNSHNCPINSYCVFAEEEPHLFTCQADLGFVCEGADCNYSYQCQYLATEPFSTENCTFVGAPPAPSLLLDQCKASRIFPDVSLQKSNNPAFQQSAWDYGCEYANSVKSSNQCQNIPWNGCCATGDCNSNNCSGGDCCTASGNIARIAVC